MLQLKRGVETEITRSEPHVRPASQIFCEVEFPGGITTQANLPHGNSLLLTVSSSARDSCYVIFSMS